ncbi:MAG: Thioredoxin reductase, partial [uncultured Nocardioides sp.]
GRRQLTGRGVLGAPPRGLAARHRGARPGPRRSRRRTDSGGRPGPGVRRWWRRAVARREGVDRAHRRRLGHGLGPGRGPRRQRRCDGPGPHSTPRPGRDVPAGPLRPDQRPVPALPRAVRPRCDVRPGRGGPATRGGAAHRRSRLGGPVVVGGPRHRVPLPRRAPDRPLPRLRAVGGRTGGESRPRQRRARRTARHRDRHRPHAHPPSRAM